MGILKQIISNWLLSDTKKGFWGAYNILGQQGAVWIDTSKPYEIYSTIPQIKAVIDRKALMFSNMELYLIDEKTGKKIDDLELQKLLQKPNILQGQNDFLREFKTQEQVYGNQFIYKNVTSRMATYPVSLWNISASVMTPELTGKIFDQTSIDGIIKYYTYRSSGTEKKYKTDEILYSRICDIDNPIVGKSPIESLKYPASNIDASYVFRNVLMRKKGALGILSNESKDSIGAIPLTDPERQRIEKQYSESYGINEEQRQIILSNATLKWQPMSYPTKDMMLFEEVDADMITVVDAFGMNINMFSNRNATFQNVQQSIVQAYQDTIIPEADQFTQSMTKFLNIKKGRRLVASFEHIPILKENKLKGMQAIDTMIKALNSAVEMGLLDKVKATQILSTELGLS